MRPSFRATPRTHLASSRRARTTRMECSPMLREKEECYPIQEVAGGPILSGQPGLLQTLRMGETGMLKVELRLPSPLHKLGEDLPAQLLTGLHQTCPAGIWSSGYCCWPRQRLTSLCESGDVEEALRLNCDACRSSRRGRSSSYRCTAHRDRQGRLEG